MMRPRLLHSSVTAAAVTAILTTRAFGRDFGDQSAMLNVRQIPVPGTLAVERRHPGPLATCNVLLQLLEEERYAAAGWFIAGVPGAADADREAAAALFAGVVQRTGRHLLPVHAFVGGDAATVLMWEGPVDATFRGKVAAGQRIDLEQLVMLRRDGIWRLVPPHLLEQPGNLDLPAEVVTRIRRLLDAGDEQEGALLEALRERSGAELQPPGRDLVPTPLRPGGRGGDGDGDRDGHGEADDDAGS